MQSQVKTGRPRKGALRIIVVFSVAVACMLATNAGQLNRRARYLATGTVTTEGFTIRLDPTDKVITQAIIRDGIWEKAETEVIKSLLRPGDTFIDVGANVGWYTLVASKAVGDRGRVIAFEPAPGSLEVLVRNVKENGVRNTKVEGKALSNKPGKLRLHIGATNKGHNSILGSTATDGFVDVEAVTLDDYLRTVDGRVRLIKIDTEGAEGFILEGMRETFDRNPQMKVVMEYHPSLMRQAGFDPATIVSGFYRRGYEVLAIEPGTGKTIPIKENRLADLTAELEKGQAFVNLLVTRPE